MEEKAIEKEKKYKKEIQESYVLQKDMDYITRDNYKLVQDTLDKISKIDYSKKITNLEKYNREIQKLHEELLKAVEQQLMSYK